MLGGLSPSSTPATSSFFAVVILPPSEYVIDCEVMAVTLAFASEPLRSRTTSWASAAAASPRARAAASADVPASFMRVSWLLDALHRLVDDRQPVGAVEALLRLLELRAVPACVGHHLLGGRHGLLVDRD